MMTCVLAVLFMVAALAGGVGAPSSGRSSAGVLPSSVASEAVGRTTFSRATITPGAGLAVTLGASVRSGPAPLALTLLALASGGSAPYSFVASAGASSGVWTAESGGAASFSTTLSYPGSYTAWVSVNDSAGDQATQSLVIWVTGSFPTGNGTGVPAQPYNISASASTFMGPWPLKVNFSATVTGSPSPENTQWEFGDAGVTGYGGDDGGPLNVSSLTHWYDDPGTYVASYVVQGSAACIQACTIAGWITIVVTNRTNGEVPLQVNVNFGIGWHLPTQPGPLAIFNATPSGGTPPYTYAWSFGDGSSSALKSTTHNYSESGDYLVRLIVTDSLGHSSLETIPINGTLSGGTPAPLLLAATPLNGPAPLTVALSTPHSGPATWLFGDGTTASGQTMGHTFEAPGVYSVSAYEESSTGIGSWAGVTVDVTPSGIGNSSQGMQVAVSGEGLVGPAPLSVDLSASVDGGSGPYSLEWRWGDGSRSSSGVGAVAEHTYASAGSFDPVLEVTDSMGATVNWTFPEVQFGESVVEVSSPPSQTTPSWQPWELAALTAAVVSATGLLLVVRPKLGGKVGPSAEGSVPPASPPPLRTGLEGEAREAPDDAGGGEDDPVGYVW